MTILANEGFEIDLFDTTFILGRRHIDNIVREKANLVLPTDLSHLYEPHTKEEVDELLKIKIKNFSPDLIALSIVEDNYAYADHLMGVVKKHKKSLPIVVGGTTPTIAPHVLIDNPKIDYLIQGEGEESLLEFCQLLDRGSSIEKVKNLWYKTKHGEIHNNPIRPFINMDDLPIQNLDLWDKRHFIKPYCGRLYKAGYFEMSRGCLNKCSYCVNLIYKKMMKNAGFFHRVKSIFKVIKEIKELKNKHDFEFIFFCDDNFLLMSNKRLNEFVELWNSEIKLPYWINTTISLITPKTLSKLKESGCAGIGIGIESGSEWIRKNILKRNSKENNKMMIKVFKMIHEFGIRTTANNMIGFPGEYIEDIFETIKLNKYINPKSCDLTFVAPYIGTVIHEAALKLSYLDVWSKPGFKNMCKNITMRRGPVINLPQITREKLIEIFYKFMDYVEGRLDIPGKFRCPAPGANADAPPRGNLGGEVAKLIRQIHEAQKEEN